MKLMHRHAQRPRVSSAVTVPAAVDAVVAKALAVEPDDRYSSVGEVVDALRAAFGPAPASGRAELCDVVAIYVDVHASQDALAAADDALFDDMEQIVPLAQSLLAQHGFALAVDTGNGALFFRRGTEDVSGAVDEANAAYASLAARDSADARVSVGVCVHVGSALVAGSAVRGGDVARLSWVPKEHTPGVVVTDAAAVLAEN